MTEFHTLRAAPDVADFSLQRRIDSCRQIVADAEAGRYVDPYVLVWARQLLRNNEPGLPESGGQT